MTDHVMQCTSNPLVQEIERLRAELAATSRAIRYCANGIAQQRTKMEKLMNNIIYDLPTYGMPARATVEVMP
jgi:ferredoxin-NADP reductase